MGKLTSFEIQLSNPFAVFYAGQTIEGEVVMELNKEMKLRGTTIISRYRI
jgi:hypothetical protein